MKLPEITEVQRWAVKPGDILVIRTNLDLLSQADADAIHHQVTRAIGTDIPLLILPRDWTIEVAESA